MAEEFNLGSGNSWPWDTSSSRATSAEAASISTTTLNGAVASFGWPSEMVPREAAAAAHGGGSSAAANPNLQIMGLGLISSQPIHWNQQTLLGEKSESSFRSMLEEDHLSSSNNFDHQQQQWRISQVEESSSHVNNDFKLEINHHQFNQLATSSNDGTMTSSHNLATTGNFQVADSSAPYYNNYPYDNNNNINNINPSRSDYGDQILPSWNNNINNNNNKFPPKQAASSLHFTNNTTFWNASPQPAQARSTYFPTPQTNVPSFDQKPKNTLEARDLSTKATKKSNTETSNKRPRNETPTPLPAFKVRKEKMGDRITALQQLVSPFGKTDTASVLSDAIEYIKFLHDQISALSDPYMKNAASIQHRHQLQNRDNKSKDGEGGNQDLRSLGLCLVPVSSTFPMAHETTVDFWTPTFGGSTFR